MKLSIIITAVALFSLTSCVKQFNDYDDVEKQTTIDENFDFETVSQEHLKISLRTHENEPIEGLVFALWVGIPMGGGQVILKGTTDANGYFSTDYNLQAVMDEFILQTNYIGLPPYLILTRDQLTSGVSVSGRTHSYVELDETLIPNQSKIENTSFGRLSSNSSVPSLTALGGYSSNGVPNYLEPDRDLISAELLSFINASLPEGRPVPSYHPKYIVESAQTNLVITETAEVWMTFVHEGAGYRNILGFYTYPTDNPPTRVKGLSPFGRKNPPFE